VNGLASDVNSQRKPAAGRQDAPDLAKRPSHVDLRDVDQRVERDDGRRRLRYQRQGAHVRLQTDGVGPESASFVERRSGESLDPIATVCVNLAGWSTSLMRWS
jgi:hypothetical protein